MSKTESGFTLEEKAEFNLPEKIYGNLDSLVQRVQDTFKLRSGNLGVLLSGIKGNSKTTLAKMICKNSGLPVILITEPFTGDGFKSYLSGMKEEVIIFIDEFEKVYNTPELQMEFLSILDGVFEGKKIFLFTTNNAEINEFLRNRPSRIFYHFKFDNLSNEVIDEIIEAELTDKTFEQDLRGIIQILGSVSIDVLLNIIDEVNRYSKSPKELIKGLNVEVEQMHFSVTLFKDGQMITTKCDFNPLVEKTFFLSYKDSKDHYGYHSGSFSDYVMYNKDGSFIFENPQYKMIFTPYKPYKFEL